MQQQYLIILLHMNMIYAGQRQRQMMQLRKNKLKQVLNYNLQEINRRRTSKQHLKYQFENSEQAMASKALQNLYQENRIKTLRRESEKNMLRESYQKQIRDKQEKERLEKTKEKEYFDRQRVFSQNEQARRMADLKKMFNRITYQGITTQPHKRLKTELYESEFPQQNPESQRMHLPTLNLKPIKTEGNKVQTHSRNDGNHGSPLSLHRNSLQNVKVEPFVLPKRNNLKHFNCQ